MFGLLIALLIHGHHSGWCQPRNPHHPVCVVQLPPSTNPPPHQIDWSTRPPVLPVYPR